MLGVLFGKTQRPATKDESTQTDESFLQEMSSQQERRQVHDDYFAKPPSPSPDATDNYGWVDVKNEEKQNEPST